MRKLTCCISTGTIIPVFILGTVAGVKGIVWLTPSQRYACVHWRVSGQGSYTTNSLWLKWNPSSTGYRNEQLFIIHSCRVTYLHAWNRPYAITKDGHSHFRPSPATPVNTNTDLAQPYSAPKSFQKQHGHVHLLTQRAEIFTLEAGPVSSWERETPELLH